MTELDAAVDTAIRLGAEQELRPADRSGYQLAHPMWLHDAVDAALPDHLGFGYVEGVLIQRGPRETGGYRVAREEDRECPPCRPSLFKGGLSRIFPTVLRARVKRVLLDGFTRACPTREPGGPLQSP